MRHQEHQNNVLTPFGTHHAELVGQSLKVEGVNIDVCYCSPQHRAIQTALAVMSGLGQTPPTYTADEIGDTKLGAFPFSAEELAEAKNGADIFRLTVENWLLNQPSRHLQTKCANRGVEGANFLRQQLKKLKGVNQTILVVSHGGARLEHMLTALVGSSYTFGLGDIVRVVFNNDLTVKKMDLMEIGPAN